MKIGIIGYGVVGKAIDYTLSKSFEIVKYDKFFSYSDFNELKLCEVVFISVPTPFDCKDYKVDDSAIIESLKKLEGLNYGGIVIIKSTVPPGSTNRYLSDFNLKIVFNPEFLRESTTPNEDFENQDTIVIGTSSINDYEIVKRMYEEVALDSAEYFHTSPSEAEMIKCSQNTMLASRVALANIIYDACIENDVNYDKVKKIAFDRFEILGPHMTLVPGPDGSRGFGGKCLPKDIRAFSTIHDSTLLNSLIAYNDTLRSDLSIFLKNYKE